MKRALLSLLIAIISIGQACAQGRPHSLTLCSGPGDFYPWHMTGGIGLNLVLLNRVAAKLGVKIIYVSYPWKRCLLEMKNGQVDGAFASSFKTDRLEMGAYPMADDGKPNPDMRLMIESYHLYKLKDSNLSWDGKQFIHLTGPISTSLGYSIVDQLKESGAEVEEVPGKTQASFDMVLFGHAQATAMVTQVGDWVISKPPYLGKMEKIPTALVQKPYFLMLSYQLLKDQPDFAHAVWDAIAQARESAEYKQAEKSFLTP